MKALLKISTLFMVLLLATSAYASGGGRVKGTLKSYNRLIHYCPSITESRNCSGSNYNENAHNAYLPVSDMKFVMRVNGASVAEFATDANGNYDFNWYYSGSGTPTNALIEGFMEHKDGRFQVLKDDGTTHRIYTTFTAYYDWIGAGNSTGYAQDLGTRYWGTIPRLITYHAAWRTWYYAFSYAGSQLTQFMNLEVKAGGTASAASFSWTNNTIPPVFIVTIPSWEMDRYSYQAVYHEMGHAASLKSAVGGTREATNLCNYPSSPAKGGAHNYNDPEWGACGFEEGYADFLGIVSHYWSGATEARACTNFGGAEPDYCANSVPQGSGVELEPNPACTGTNEERFQRNTTTFLWDYYDTTNEGMGDSLNEGYWHFLDANSDLLDSTGTNGKDEAWNAAKTAIDEGDGRSLQDFRHMLYNKFGDLNITLYQTHCSPPGDY